MTSDTDFTRSLRYERDVVWEKTAPVQLAFELFERG